MKKMVSWRLDAEMLARLQGEADELTNGDLTALVEEKLETPHPLVEILSVLRRIEKKVER